MQKSIKTVQALLKEIEELGARVSVAGKASEKKIAAAEKALGFKLPAEYREFLEELGPIEIELVRTWFFYGVGDDEGPKDLYEGEFAEALEEAGDDAEDGGPYYPTRFVVLADEGDYCNAAEGFVYDADQEHIRPTAGGRYMEVEEHVAHEYWAFLIEQLERIRDRIADPDDEIVSGNEDEINSRRKLG